MANKVQRKSTARKFEVISGEQTTIVGVDATWNSTVDVGACLSRINHRLFRQGRQYKVRVSADQNSFSDATSPIEVWALAPTWWVNAAWRKAKAAYDDALSDEKKVLNEQNLAKWRDFRVACGMTGPVSADDAIALGGATPHLSQLPSLGGSNAGLPPFPYTQGEFNLATAKNLDTGATMSFTWGAGSATEFGILTEYTRTRNESATPETVITVMPYESLSAEGEDLDYQELQANGNEPPYYANAFEQACWVLVGTLSPQDLGPKTTNYFAAPCGIVIIRNSHTSTVTEPTLMGKVSVEVAEGEYHGVHAPAM